MTLAPVRVGVVGGGMWATDLHIPLHRTPGSTVLSGVWVRSADARERLRRSGVPVVDSFDGLLEDCEAVDFAVPPTAQPELACVAAEAGRHVMLEKPSALDPADARRISSAVSRAGVVSTMLLTRRFHPVVRARLRDIASQSGPVLGVQGAHVHGGLLDGGFVGDASTWRDELGVLIDLGPHLLDLGEQLAGPIAEVRVREHDGWLTVDALHEGGSLGQYAMSGRIDVTAGTMLQAFTHDGAQSIETRGLDMSEAFAIYRDEFAGAVRNDTPVTVDAERGVALSILIDACRRSLGAGGVAMTVDGALA